MSSFDKNETVNKGLDTFTDVIQSRNFKENPQQTYTLMLIIMFGMTLVGIFFIAYYILVDLNYSVITLNNSVIELTTTLKELIRR